MYFKKTLKSFLLHNIICTQFGGVSLTDCSVIQKLETLRERRSFLQSSFKQREHLELNSTLDNA